MDRALLFARCLVSKHFFAPFVCASFFYFFLVCFKKATNVKTKPQWLTCANSAQVQEAVTYVMSFLQVPTTETVHRIIQNDALSEWEGLTLSPLPITATLDSCGRLCARVRGRGRIALCCDGVGNDAVAGFA